MAGTGIIRALLNTQRSQVFGLTQLRGMRKLRTVYERSRADLEQQLSQLVRAGAGRSFTAYHLRVVLLQVMGTVNELQDAMGDQLTKEQRIATALAQRQVINATKTLEKQFTGHAPALSIEHVAVLRGIDRSVTPSLLDRYKRSTRLYGAPVVRKVKMQLALSLTQGETVDQAVDRVAGTNGIFAGERWRAERIVRTELSYGFHAVQQRTLVELRGRDMPDLQKRLVATKDDREGDDSKELDGQTVPIDRPFVWINKTKTGTKRVEYMHPPNRPNDREVVIPFRPSWKAGAVPTAGPVTPRAPSDDTEV